MKTFITGGPGFVGSHIIDKLLEKGHEVFCLRRKTSNIRWLEGKEINFVDGDLFSDEILKKTISEMDYIIHTAGVIKSKTKKGYEIGNILATRNIIKLTYEINPDIKKFIHISSQAVCGPNLNENPIDENYIPKPITTYGKTKLKAEMEVLKFKDKLPVTIIRPPSIYGPRDTEIFVYFKIFSKGLNPIIGFYEKYLSIIYIKDLIEGIYSCLDNELSNGQIYFITSDRAYNWEEIGNTISKIIDKKSIKIRIPHFMVYLAGYISEFFSLFSTKASTLNIEKCKDITRERWVCSNQKAKNELGFGENYTLEEGFKETINWYKNMKWL